MIGNFQAVRLECWLAFQALERSSGLFDGGLSLATNVERQGQAQSSLDMIRITANRATEVARGSVRHGRYRLALSFKRCRKPKRMMPIGLLRLDQQRTGQILGQRRVTSRRPRERRPHPRQ